ncbi:MAG TPA: phosphoribosylaminoimidazolesuccinocarboxamide synthase [Methylomirabilota bacterium]|jgi:phosphoribosylaminoimidazole-succinocarboxamide synthase|nr:phosphoribosylaminoimidazolesuccinocarboxamide synthase [Methylomirabilota bacterium]
MAIVETSLAGLTLHGRGKVRDIYDLGETFLIVASDRLSAFDVVLPTPIPDKGKVLTQMSEFWFDHFKALVPHHLISTRVEDFPPEVRRHREQVQGRSMLVRKATVFPVECVVRGYLAGSGLKDYQKTGAICGVSLPPGLRESDRLPEPIFTPATKAAVGLHDENISEAEAGRLIGSDNIRRLKALSLEIYNRAAEYAAKRGIIVCDTKFEFGTIDGRITLIDEVLTPDSSRFWPADQYSPGKPQPSYDKQFVRDYLEQIGFNKRPPGPALPDDVVRGTSAKYVEALTRITGRPLREA